MAQVPNDSERFVACSDLSLTGAKAFRVTAALCGKKRTVLVMYNTNLHDTQLYTVRLNIAKAIEELSALRQRLSDRAAGFIKRGRSPSKASSASQYKAAPSRQNMKEVVKTTLTLREGGVAQLEYAIDEPELARIGGKLLG